MAVFDNVVRVYDKSMKLLAIFDGDVGAVDGEAMKNLMVAPTVHRETNGESTLTFQMVVNSEKWQTIKNPENIYTLNGHHYTALNDGAFQFTSEEGVRLVNVTLVETWYLLDKKFTQAYNCGIYCYAKAHFSFYTTDGAVFTITSNECSNPSNTISSSLAWNQVKLWSPKDDDGNQLTYGILQSDDFKPTKWENAPSGVFFTSFVNYGSYAQVTIRSRAKTQVQKNFEYTGSSYSIDTQPYPTSIDSVYVNTTVETKESGSEGQTYTRYSTSNKVATYNYSNGRITLTYYPASNETINSVIVLYSYYDLGEISNGATCTFAYGAEVVDEHTFAILPKTKTKYKLTVNGVEYDDNQVKDSRGVVMPRGSGGYALWAALRDTGWSLGVCDVIAQGFDTSIDYGCFNIESDMKNVLYNIQYIQELYGGILDWDSENKVVNYRAENTEDYQAYNDGFNKWTGYEFREGKNMTNQPEITWDNEIITKGYLLGYGNLNVKDVNNGKSYVENHTYTTDVYEGYLEQPLIYDTRDDGGKKQLLYWGQREMWKMCKPRVKLTASVTDIRTVEGYEHEIFDLNNIVRCYYKDSKTGEEVYEEKRITLWEYNAFALWDCTVEIGDKTQNFIDTFKLIYNSAIKEAPKTNASGQISSDEVVVEVPDLGEIEYEYGDWGSISGISGGGGYGGLSIEDYISLIAQKTTKNSDAIAGLTLQATDLYAQAELFTQYQKTTENMISETYAGLTLYSDEKSSALELVVEGHYQEMIRDVNSLNSYIGSVETYTQAGFQAQQTQNQAFTTQFSQMDTTITNVKTNLREEITTRAEFQTEVTREYAKISGIASYVNNEYDKGTLTCFTKSEAGLRAWADKDSATAKLLASFTTGKNGETISSLSELIAYADKNGAYSSLLSSFSANGITSTAGLRSYVNNNTAVATLSAYIGSSGSVVRLTDTYANFMSGTGTTASRVQVASGYVSLYSSGSIIIGDSNTFLSVLGNSVSWKSATIGGTTITYLGR